MASASSDPSKTNESIDDGSQEPSSEIEEQTKESQKFYNNRSEFYAYMVTFILLFMRIAF